MSARFAWATLALALVMFLAPGAHAQQEDTLTRAAALRRRGDDLAAARLLESERRHHPSARVSAELGLAYQGASRPVDAERNLAEALESEGDAWVEEHRAGLAIALRYARASVGWVVVLCDAPDAEVRAVDSASDPVACGEPLRIGAGERAIEVRAYDHQSVRQTVSVSPGERARVEVSLEPFECESAGMQHVGGEAGGCCWPGQSTIEGACVGVPECPDGGWLRGNQCMSPDTSRPGPPRLATFHLGLYGGVTNFARTDTSLFRPGVAPSGQLGSLGPRVELRAGIHLFALFALDLTVGGTRQELGLWLDCAPGAPSCANRAPLAYTFDAGVMFTAHSDPPRFGGNVDFHVGVGARPFARIFFDDDAGGAELTAVVVPAELGMSIYFADLVSLDVIGQAELWIPWEYRGHGADGAAYTLGSDALDYELAWTGLAGLTLHVD